MRKKILVILITLLFTSLFTLGKDFYAGEQRNVRQNSQNGKSANMVALTFDDGPTVKYTPDVLRILEEYDINATFFLVGKQVEINPDIAIKAIAQGHQIENHTFNHAHLDDMTTDELITEIRDTDAAFKEILGIDESNFFRPPRKAITDNVIEAVAITDKVMALWTIGVENSSVSTPEDMRDRVLKWAPKGGVILLHDGSPGSNRDTTIQTLPLLIDAYLEKGYKFVTLNEYFASVDDKQSFPYNE